MITRSYILVLCLHTLSIPTLYLGDFPRSDLSLLFLNSATGDVELTNMQLKPEALNALKLPVKVKAGFLGSVKLKVCGDNPPTASLRR